MSKTSSLKNTRAVKQLSAEVAVQTITLATSGFGLVAALAWNELIKTVIEQYIRPYLGRGSDVISLGIYAVITTALAVVITIQLGRLRQRLTKKSQSTQ